tara:strand:- start:68 stop:1330 length:1263 start_codon:yes stop_codon:yes gene_type:complete
MSVTDTGSALNFQNVEDSKQIWDLRMTDDGITASTVYRFKGLFPPKLTYKDGKWTGNGAEARAFLKNKKNLKNLNTNANNLYKSLDESEQTNINYTPTDNNKATTRPTNPLTRGDLGLGSVDIPRDPEGFFIGRYPLNQKDTDNFDYLRITCYDYEPGLFSGGGSFFKIDDIDKRVKKRRGVVSLPIQPGISEQNSVGWGNDEINPLQLAGAGAAGAAMSGISNFIAGEKEGAEFFNRVGDTGKAALASVDQRLIKSFFAGQAVGANIIGRGNGLAINNNVEVLFNGPNLRTFNYNYRFTPREPKEADKIKQIIRFFKKTMAPKRSTSRIFLKSPDVFKLKYTFKNGDSHPFLNNIKICALNSFTVDYTPDGSYSTYDDDGGRGDGSMTSYQVGISFMEMTPIYNDDFWNDDEGKEGTGF